MWNLWLLCLPSYPMTTPLFFTSGHVFSKYLLSPWKIYTNSFTPYEDYFNFWKLADLPGRDKLVILVTQSYKLYLWGSIQIINQTIKDYDHHISKTAKGTNEKLNASQTKKKEHNGSCIYKLLTCEVCIIVTSFIWEKPVPMPDLRPTTNTLY